jgi:uncharacterized protein YwqG
MGGIPDAIQSSPTAGPTEQALLFQIVTDDGMHWVWGDAGAYYVYIDAARLKAHDFTRLNSTFENH